jgi:CRP-like cAMP-binding protein
MSARHSALARISPSVRALLADADLADALHDVSPDEELFGPQDPPDSPLLIISGLIRLYEPSDEERQLPRTIGWFGAGELIALETTDAEPGEGDEPWTLTAVAAEATQVMKLSRERLALHFAREPQLALEVIGQLAGRLHRMQLEASEQVRLEAPHRLANTLRRLSSVVELSDRDGDWQIIRLTHADLASKTGISRETVSLILSRWRRAGAVQTGRRRLAYHPQKLGALLNGDGA